MPDDTGDCDFYLSDISVRDKPWDDHRANAAVVQTLYDRSPFQRYADRIQHCSRLLEFALEAQDSGEFKLRLQNARFCRVRQCPVCQWRRSLMWRARFFQAIPKVQEAYPTHRWVFLTLTVRNVPLTGLKIALQEMNVAWKRMVERKQFPAIGFVRSMEVTRSADGTAHPHFHCLLLVPSSYFSTGYISHAQWTDLWKHALRVNYTPIVHVKAVKNRKGDTTQEAISVALLETIKYGVKEQDLIADSVWLIELTNQLHKTRAVTIGGVLRQFIKQEEPEDLIRDDEESDEKIDRINWFFSWKEIIKKYVKMNPH